MLTKLESKSNRVKGLSFHPTRPWILASLHNGIVQLWDYRVRTLLDRFDEHDGPVRGVCFHLTQPLFVSGGDDYKIKVWNYKQRRCLFTLLGHLDYIRTVEFHREYPWILSASDDQTIRIWNWQSRTCIAVLTGHNHYVMCASFHPKEDLVVSASLDQTVRVWDVAGLRKKTVSPGIGSIGGVGMAGMNMGPGSSGEEGIRLPPNELFGNTDAIVKYVLEGHDRGVNWAAFHNTSPLIVSGADDRQVKLWRMNETKAWEVDTFRGHFNNVSCVLFHPRQELIISNSEDKTIRVWDIAKRVGIQTFRREHDRFWILAAHPEMNLFAAGHDNGMIVFKLERERPAYSTVSGSTADGAVFYVKDKYIRAVELSTTRDIPVIALKSGSGSAARANGKLRMLTYSPQDRAILISSENEGGFYELYQIPKDSGSSSKGSSSDGVDCKRGVGHCGVFVGRKRFAVLDSKQHTILVKNMKNEETKKILLQSQTSASVATADAMFPAPAGLVLLRCEDRIVLFDLQQKKSISELQTQSEIKSALWSSSTSSIPAGAAGANEEAPIDIDLATPKNTMVALLSKDTIIIANRKLEQLCSVHETIRIKSGAWDENGIFLYSTLNHIKYCLPNGDHGIIRTIDGALYIVGVRGNKVYCLDRECKNRVLSVDTTEYMFKHALINRKYQTVLKMVKQYNLIGNSIISYLQKKGFPEVALHFVKDDKTRFNLALECGNIEVALESCKVLDDKDSWHRLGVEALRQGNHQIVELAYQRTRNYERISFLYVITGNTEKLKKMVKISQMRNDTMARFHNALYLGDVTERTKVLEEVGQLGLAYICAVSHGLHEEAEVIKQKMIASNPSLESTLSGISNSGTLLQPPIPIFRLHDSNWPLLTVSKGYFDQLANADEGSTSSDKFAAEVTEESGAWGELDIEKENGEEESEKQQVNLEENVEAPVAETEGTSWDVDIDLGDEANVSAPSSKTKAASGFVVLPSNGPSAFELWCANSNHACDHAAASSVETAIKLLNQQVGIVNFAPLEPLFVQMFIGSRAALPTLPGSPSLVSPLQRNSQEAGPKGGLPVLPINLQSLIEVKLKNAYRSTTSGKFQESLSQFVSVLHSLLFIVVNSKKELNEAKELLTICREYITGLRMELKRKDESSVRQAELAAYFTHCNLQQVHLLLCLRSAMNCAYKIKNFSIAASFARRLLELEPKSDVATQAMKVVKQAEQTPENAIELNYNERNPFVVCGISFVPIYKGTPQITCPFCQASFLPEHKGKLCPTCQLAQIGKESSGLLMYTPPK